MMLPAALEAIKDWGSEEKTSDLAFGHRLICGQWSVRSYEIKDFLALMQLRRNFAMIKRALQLHHAPYTLGSLCAGGAVEFPCRTNNSSSLQVRGRWMSAKSLYHYTQMYMAAPSMLQLAASSSLPALLVRTWSNGSLNVWQDWI
eukprot:2400917-Amphidinium_carterae.1